MYPKIIFDLDGPILDVSDKYYAIYKTLSVKYGALNVIEIKEYWEQKKSKISEKEILIKSGVDEKYISNYLLERKNIIEDREYLKKDRLFPFTLDVLKYLKNSHELYLITLRNNRENLLFELKYFNIINYFEFIYSENNNCGTWETKYKLAKPIEIMKERRSYFVGDTEADILAAKQLKLISIVVESGIRNRKILEELNPDFIIPDIKYLRGIIC